MVDTPPPTVRRVAAVVVVGALLAGSVTAAGVLAGTTAPAAEDAPDEMADAEPLTYNETVEGNISNGDDVDWYRVDATAGDALIATMYGHENDNRSYAVQLYTASGAEVTHVNAEGGDGTEYVGGNTLQGGQGRQPVLGVDVAEYDGPYYVKVSWYDRAATEETNESLTVPYNLTVTTNDLDEHDPNENGTTATPISLGQPTAGVIASYDQDVYAVDLDGGTNYTVQYNATHNSWQQALGVFADAANVTHESRIIPVEGARYVNHAIMENGTLQFTPEQDGTYYLAIGQYRGTVKFLTEDSYTVTVEPTNASNGTDSSPDDGTDDGTGDGSGDGPTDVTATTTDAGTRSATDGDATETETTTVGPGGGGSGSPSPTASPTEGGGPGFGVAVALVSLLGVALLATRRLR